MHEVEGNLTADHGVQWCVAVYYVRLNEHHSLNRSVRLDPAHAHYRIEGNYASVKGHHYFSLFRFM
jgi:hypothetical protein